MPPRAFLAASLAAYNLKIYIFEKNEKKVSFLANIAC
jgi:hypothetical protein